jgi:squalene-hopene/tetraprenyl-beta-curcumene cyclase
MQNADGGWGSLTFDAGNKLSTPETTGRALEALAAAGERLGDAAIDRAVAWLRTLQLPNGSWSGPSGRVEATSQVLMGLDRAGLPGDDPAMVAGSNWLLTQQQPCGGWGDADERATEDLCTPSQTARAVLGLFASGLGDHPASARGIRFLLDEQQDDGTWREPAVASTPSSIRSTYDAACYPLMALAHWAVSATVPVAEAAPRELDDANGDETSYPRLWTAAG